MKVVWKFPAVHGTKIENFVHKLLHVGPDPTGLFCLWVEVDADKKVAKPYRLVVIGTGMTVPINCEYAGTFNDGLFVWHVYMLNGEK